MWKKFDKIGQYYIHMTNVNDNSSIVNKRVTWLTDAARVAIYNCNTFIIQATHLTNQTCKKFYKIGQYYKHMTIVNDDSSIINKCVASLTDATRVVIYNCTMSIIKAAHLTTQMCKKFYKIGPWQKCRGFWSWNFSREIKPDWLQIKIWFLLSPGLVQ